MDVTPEGIVTLVKLVHLLNAWVPIAVTGFPPKVPGMVTAPPEPV